MLESYWNPAKTPIIERMGREALEITLFSLYICIRVDILNETLVVLPSAYRCAAIRLTSNRQRHLTTLDVIRYACKEVWSAVFGTQIDKLQTDHKVSTSLLSSCYVHACVVQSRLILFAFVHGARYAHSTQQTIAIARIIEHACKYNPAHMHWIECSCLA
jgi:hypothetical protein